jgi:hypothetical protein
MFKIRELPLKIKKYISFKNYSENMMVYNGRLGTHIYDIDY